MHTHTPTHTHTHRPHTSIYPHTYISPPYLFRATRSNADWRRNMIGSSDLAPRIARPPSAHRVPPARRSRLIVAEARVPHDFADRFNTLRFVVISANSRAGPLTAAFEGYSLDCAALRCVRRFRLNAWFPPTVSVTHK